MHIGFTGTQKGMTNTQSEKVEELLLGVMKYESAMGHNIILHHGDCVGADEDVHMMARAMGTFDIAIHPPLNPSRRAHMKGDITFEEGGYLDRNKVIVQMSDILIAAPASEAVRRSGTWATIRYARTRKVPITIVMPDGKVYTNEGIVIV